MENTVEDSSNVLETEESSKKIEEVVCKIEETVKESVSTLEDVSKAEDMIHTVVEHVLSNVDDCLKDATPEIKEIIEPVTHGIESNEVIKKVVTVLDEKLATRGCSFSLFGWVVSIHKSHQTDQTVPSK